MIFRQVTPTTLKNSRIQTAGLAKLPWYLLKIAVGIAIMSMAATAPAYPQSKWEPDLRSGGRGSEKFPTIDMHRHNDFTYLDSSGKSSLPKRKLTGEDRDSLAVWLRSGSVHTLSELLQRNLARFTPDKQSRFLAGYQERTAYLPPVDTWMIRLALSDRFQKRLEEVDSYGEEASPEWVEDMLLGTKAGFPLKGRTWQGCVYRTSQYADFGRLNSHFLSEELRNEDGRNHASLHTGEGYGLALEKLLTERSGLRFTVERVRYRSIDRQTWQVADEVTGEQLYPRDEQRVEAKIGTLTIDYFLRGYWDKTRWGVHLGGQLLAGRVAVDYKFSGESQYAFETDWAYTGGLRTGVSLSLPIAGPVTLNTMAGLRAVLPRKLEAKERDWYWHGPSGTSEQATLELSGAYWNLGLGVRM